MHHPATARGPADLNPDQRDPVKPHPAGILQGPPGAQAATITRPARPWRFWANAGGLTTPVTRSRRTKRAPTSSPQFSFFSFLLAEATASEPAAAAGPRPHAVLRCGFYPAQRQPSSTPTYAPGRCSQVRMVRRQDQGVRVGGKEAGPAYSRCERATAPQATPIPFVPGSNPRATTGSPRPAFAAKSPCSTHWPFLSRSRCERAANSSGPRPPPGAGRAPPYTILRE